MSSNQNPVSGGLRTEAPHTPTPWVARALGSEGYTITPQALIGLSGREERELANHLRIRDICRVMGGQWPTLRANAEYIVQCVNSHDALVDACKDALRYYDDMFWSEEEEFVVASLTNALTLATNGGTSAQAPETPAYTLDDYESGLPVPPEIYEKYLQAYSEEYGGGKPDSDSVFDYIGRCLEKGL